MVSFFLNEVHNKILMEEYRYDGKDFTKKQKKSFLFVTL